MADESKRNRPHIFLPKHGKPQKYTARGSGGGGDSGLPPRDRLAHAEQLIRALTAAVQAGEKLVAARDSAIAGGVPGFYLEFEMPKDQTDILDRLESRKTKKLPAIELSSVHPLSDDKIAATVYVPEAQRDYYLKKVAEYRDKDTPKGNPANQPLIDAIDTVRLALARSLYTDQPDLFPQPEALTWWEAWLHQGTSAAFKAAAQSLELGLRDQALVFADREVFLVRATVEGITRIVQNTDSIAELRLARDTPALFMAMDGAGQREWSQELADRITAPPANAPAVCLLDSGTTYRHPLIRPALNPADQQAYDGSSPEDGIGHGTQLSGIALHGDLMPLVLGNAPVELRHRLESVRILPNHVEDQPELYGAITEQAVYRAEVTAPHRRRAVCLAITNPGNYWNGRPSSWSGALDKLAFGEPDIQRLVLVAAGNIRIADEPIRPVEYPYRNDTSPVESPAQAWNALAVGAYTEQTNISDPTLRGWTAFAPPGDLSPTSRTSVAWHHDWPIKPDLVMEGGNFGVDPATGAADFVDDLGLLTTYHRPEERAFTVTGETSAASALAARMAAQIWAEHPQLWPETVRALMVHSAEWTKAMTDHLAEIDKKALVRRYGFGVPDLARALRSFDHDVTMVIENTMQPFSGKGSSIETQDLVLHQLPWPKEILGDLGAAQVRMRVTLSYFIEPAPGERGETKRHSYASHGLRFDVKRRNESDGNFIRRINGAAGDKPKSPGPDQGWTLGPKLRHRGSIHADIWEGSAADLAARGAIAVYPVDGWWRKNPAQDRGNSTTRYSLIISLQAAEGVDLYNAIQTAIKPAITIET
jgi:hypothetical protein